MIPLAASAALSAVSSLTSLLGAAASSDATPKATAKDGNTVTQADFMQLLVAQLQNQDPLNPLDSANFSAQLAQFSSLQQLTEINQTLKNADTGGSSVGKLDAVGFLGKEVRGASNTVDVKSGAASALDYTLATSGTVEAKILDASGGTIADAILGAQDAGPHTLYVGTLAGVPKLADGTYTVELYVGDGNGNATPVATMGGGVVTGVDLSGDAPVLLIGDRRIAVTDVREVRVQPPAGT